MCGIFGFAGKLGNHEFNVLKFATLGMINDSRGGDSAGAFIDGKCEYGIGLEKLFADFATKNPFIRGYENKSVQYALGHCRKASVGAKTIREAQPVCVPDDDGLKTELVMIHNGTLINHDELKDKYLADVPEYFTDSQIFANVVYYYGFKVLAEYEGAGAFAFIDYREKVPTAYLFRGESHMYSSSTTTSSERPLFWMHTEEGIWFSSIKSSLELISLGKYKVEEVPGNTLIAIRDGKVISTKKIDRSNRHQLKSTVSKAYYSGSYYSGYSGYGGYDDYEDDYYNAYNKKHTNSEISYNISSLAAGYDEKAYDTPTSAKVIFKPDGRYYKGGTLLDGALRISEYGFENTYSSVGTSTIARPKTFYFFEGFLMKDALCMHIAKKIKERAGERFKYEMLRKLTMTCFYDPTTEVFYTRKGKLFTGSYPVYFTLSNKIFKVKNGKVFQEQITYNPNNCTAWKSYSPQYEGDDVLTKYGKLIEKSANKILSIYNI